MRLSQHPKSAEPVITTLDAKPSEKVGIIREMA
jgi:hypothetical protein